MLLMCKCQLRGESQAQPVSLSLSLSLQLIQPRGSKVKNESTLQIVTGNLLGLHHQSAVLEVSCRNFQVGKAWDGMPPFLPKQNDR